MPGAVKIKVDITQMHLSKGKRTNMLRKRQTVLQSPMCSESEEKTPNSQRQNTNNDIQGKHSSVKDQRFLLSLMLRNDTTMIMPDNNDQVAKPYRLKCQFSRTNHNDMLFLR